MKWNCLLIGRKITGVTSMAIVSGFVVYETNKQKQKGFAPWILDHESESLTKWDNDWDRREPDRFLSKNSESKLATSPPISCRHLFLIRHGQYNVSGETDKEQGLTELGRQQASMTGKRLKEYGHTYARLVSSRLKRAQETSSIIKESFPSVVHEETDLLTEGAPLKPEPPVDGWSLDEDPFFKDSARIEAGFRHFIHRAEPTQTQDSFEIFVCHANVIRYFVIRYSIVVGFNRFYGYPKLPFIYPDSLSYEVTHDKKQFRALQLPPQAWLRMTLNHGSITWVTVYPTGQVKLQKFGDTGFMPVDICTTYNFPDEVVD